jgi:hypothetical protein
MGTSSQISNNTYILLVGPVYKDVELLVRYDISETYLKLFKMCWVGQNK